MGTTPNYAIPYPELTDPPDGAGQMKALCNRVDTVLKTTNDRIIIATSTTRPAATAGVILFETDTNRFVFGISVSGVKFWAPAPGALVFQIRQTVSQSIPDGTATPVTWGATDYDPYTFWSSGSRVIPKIPGWYEFAGAITYLFNASGSRQTVWGRNGAGFAGGGTFTAPAGVGATTVLARSFPIYCNGTTDYVEQFATQTSGAPLNTAVSGTSAQSNISAKYLGP